MMPGTRQETRGQKHIDAGAPSPSSLPLPGRTRGRRGSGNQCWCVFVLPGDGAGQVIKLTIDGMDQAKFRVPRNLVPLWAKQEEEVEEEEDEEEEEKEEEEEEKEEGEEVERSRKRREPGEIEREREEYSKTHA